MSTKSDEARAAAEAAIGARQKVTDAKAAADAAGGADEALNDALAAAEKTATEAESTAIALSQALPPADDVEKRKQKLLRKRSFINKDLKALGVDADDEEENEDDEDEDDSKPLTRGDYKKMQAQDARKTAQQLAAEISDPLDRQAVLDSLQLVVPTGNPEKDLKSAVAIANIDRNSKILDELGRRPITRAHPTSTGAPANRVEDFVPTAHEQMFMSKMGLTKNDILKARAAGAK